MSNGRQSAEADAPGREYDTLIHTVEGVDGRRRAIGARAAVRAADESEAAHAAVNHYLESLDDTAAMRDGIGPGARVGIHVFADTRTAGGLDTEVWHVDILLDGKNPVVH